MTMTNLWKQCLEIGDQFEMAFVKAMKDQYPDVVVIKEDHRESLFDFSVYLDGEQITYELKSIAGVSPTGRPYSTFCVEILANDRNGPGVRPGWYEACDRGILDRFIVLNRYTGKVHSFDAQALFAYVQKIELKQTGSRASNGGTGLVVTVPWDSEEAGLISIKDLSPYL